MSEFSDEGFDKPYSSAWEQLHNDETDGESGRTPRGDAPDRMYDSEIIPEHVHEDASWPPPWADFDFTPATFAEPLEDRNIPYAFGIRQFDGIEPTHDDLVDNMRDFYNTESKLFHTHQPYVDRKTIAGEMGSDYDDVMPVMSYQHLDLSATTPDGAIKITIDGSMGLMVDFYGADGSVSHNRYYADLVNDATYDEAIFVDRTNRDQLLAHIPALGAVPEAERQQMIVDAEAVHNDVLAAKKAQRTPVSREELKHALSLAEGAATPTIVSFYDMLYAAENRANGNNNVSLAASEYAAQTFTDQVNAFLGSFGLDTGPAPGGEPRFQNKIVTDGPHVGMVVKCGYTERTESKPSQPVAIIILKEMLNQAQFHERLPDDVAAMAALYPTGGRSEQRVLLSVINGRLHGAITKSMYGSGSLEPLSKEHQRLTPDDAHTQLFGKIAQNPQIYNQQMNNR
jgi:hypothetical protein